MPSALNKLSLTSVVDARLTSNQQDTVRLGSWVLMTLAELKQKYKLEKAKYEPNPDCRFCKGAGERPIKREPDKMMHCVCLFLHPEFSNELGTLLSTFATKQLKEMDDQKKTLQGDRNHTRQ